MLTKLKQHLESTSFYPGDVLHKKVYQLSFSHRKCYMIYNFLKPSGHIALITGMKLLLYDGEHDLLE